MEIAFLGHVIVGCTGADPLTGRFILFNLLTAFKDHTPTKVMGNRRLAG
jgi:hypothetical protein